MEPLAYLECIGRSGEVVSRHPLYRWPVRVGRGYDMDALIDDPYLAPSHLSIEPAVEGRYLIRDLGTLNGMHLTDGKKIAEFNAGPDDIVRAGHTRLRVRPVTHAVVAEVPLRNVNVPGNTTLFTIFGGLLILMTLWNAYLSIFTQDGNPVLITATLAMTVAVLLWVSVWALISRIVVGRADFFAHGAVAVTGACVLFVTEVILEYVGFGLDIRWLDYVGAVATAILVAYIFFRHLSLASRASARALSIAAVGVTAVVYAGSMAMDYSKNVGDRGKQNYDTAIKAPLFLLVKGITADTFFAQMEPLKRKVDEAVAKDQ